MNFHNISTATLVAALTTTTDASVSVFTSNTAWQAISPPYSSITFTELPPATWISNQYSALGVLFTDGSDQVYTTSNFITDGYGLNGAFDESTLTFESPMTTLALEFPGTVRVRLYSANTLIYESPVFGTMPTGNFRGLISTEPFSSAVLDDPFSGLFIDNIYFGPPIPAPGAGLLLGVVIALPWRKRRAV